MFGSGGAEIAILLTEENFVDAQVIMSATANPEVCDRVAELGYWFAFASVTEPKQIVSLVSAAMETPQFSLKSDAQEKGELRFQLEEKLGLAGFVNQGEVEIAFPFVRGGRRYEMEIVKVVEAPSGLVRWISADFRGIEVTFFDALHTLGRAEYGPGETYPFFLNALALTLKRVQPLGDPAIWDGEILFATTGYRTFLSSGRRERDELIFQCPLDGEPQSTDFADRSFAIVPISLLDDEETLIDLFVAPEIIETIGSPLKAGEDIAGVLWLQGYSPELLETTK
jgi:hypothetical protein